MVASPVHAQRGTTMGWRCHSLNSKIRSLCNKRKMEKKKIDNGLKIKSAQQDFKNIKNNLKLKLEQFICHYKFRVTKSSRRN